MTTGETKQKKQQLLCSIGNSSRWMPTLTSII